MEHTIRFECFSVPVIAYNADSIICGENDLALQLVDGVSYIGKTLSAFLNALPETHTTHILFEQNALTILELSENLDLRKASGVMQIEHELITPLDRMRSRLHKLKLSAEDQKFFDSIFLTMRKKVQSITLEMNFRKGNIPLNKSENCNLSGTLEHLVAAVNQHYGHDIIALELQDRNIFADYDESKLLHALLQLISNAVKMTPAEELPVITISLSQNEKGTKITVSDCGIGFPKGKHELLTEAYHQADNSFTKSVPGLGVGLYLVKKIVSLHQGSLELHNNKSGGARVTITLPPKRMQGKGAINSPPPQLSLEVIKERTAFLLIDVPLNKE